MECQVGDAATRSLEVTGEAVEAFARLTGDRNPLHFDEAFVEGTRYERLLAQGGIATGLLHALVAMDLPGPGSVFVRQRWSFPRPVYIGDTIEARGEVTAVRPRRSFAEMAFVVTNQHGETVLEGDALVYQAVPGDAAAER